MKTVQIFALLHFQMPVTWKYMCQNHKKKLVKQEKQHSSIVLNSNRIHFFGFAVVITPQFANMLIFCEPTQSEQEFSAKMNISAIFDSAISVCKAFFQILKLRTVFVCVFV